MGRRIAAALLALSIAAPAAALEVQGSAAVGSEQRPVTLRLDCEPKTGIAAVLTIARFEGLPFDFDAFEGPTGSTAPLTELRVSNAAGVRTTRARASGAVAVDPSTSFVFTVAPTRRGEAPLREVALALAEPGAKLIWSQSAVKKGATPLLATISIPEDRNAALRTTLGPCLQGF